MSDATLSRTTLNPGDLLEGKYRIKQKLAEGGMGAVYHAIQEPLGRDVAIKVLKSFDESPEERENRFKRFFREAAICSRLNHPNTVMIFDYGKLSSGDGFFLAMEFLRGESLRDLLNKHGVLTTSLALHVAIQIAGSLADAHAGSVVHRDLKPPNIMLVERGGDPYFVKVVDFGLVKDLNRGEETGELTAENTLIGSPMYMAPERFLYHSADSPAVDTYALGIMLYEMLVGRPPFIRESDSTIHRIMMQHIQEEPPPMRHFKPDLRLPDGLEQLIQRCLVKDPNQRIQSMDMLVRLLKACQNGSAIDVPPLQPQLRPPLGENTSDHLLQQNTQNTVKVNTAQQAMLAQQQQGTGNFQQPMQSNPGFGQGTGNFQQPGFGQGTGNFAQPGLNQGTGNFANPGFNQGTGSFQQPHPSAQFERPVQESGSSKKLIVGGIVTLVSVIVALVAFNMFKGIAPTPLVVETTPPGAQVLVNGRAVGVTPVNLKVELAEAGTLRIEKEGFKPFERGLSPSSETVVVALPLEAIAVEKAPVAVEAPVEKPELGASQRAQLRTAGCLDEYEDLCADLQVGKDVASCLVRNFKTADAECQAGLRELAKNGWAGLADDASGIPELPAAEVKPKTTKTTPKQPENTGNPGIKLGR